jgi:hypothetical protein
MMLFVAASMSFQAAGEYKFEKLLDAIWKKSFLFSVMGVPVTVDVTVPVTIGADISWTMQVRAITTAPSGVWMI